MIFFGPKFRWEVEVKDGLRVTARRVVLSPDYQYCPTAGWSNDLALMDFDAMPVLEALAKAGARPATLFAGTVMDELTDGRIVGFGLFATQDSQEYLQGGEVHAGVTRVVPVTSGGRLTLRHFSPLQEYALSWGKAGETKDSRLEAKLNKLRFLKVLMPYPLLTPFSGKPILVQSHPCQSLVAKSDSGGPLFLKVTGKGHQVVGIASHNRQFLEPAEPGVERQKKLTSCRQNF
jgi:hypothetical protein